MSPKKYELKETDTTARRNGLNLLKVVAKDKAGNEAHQGAISGIPTFACSARGPLPPTIEYEAAHRERLRGRDGARARHFEVLAEALPDVFEALGGAQTSPPSHATARSGFPCREKSAAARANGRVLVVSGSAVKKLPSPTPKRIVTEMENELATARSTIVSPWKSVATRAMTGSACPRPTGSLVGFCPE